MTSISGIMSPSTTDDYKESCCGSSLLFVYDKAIKSNKIEQMRIMSRVKLNSLNLQTNKVLLLENFIKQKSVPRSSGLLMAYRCDGRNDWHLGVVLFQSLSMTGVANARLNGKVRCQLQNNVFYFSLYKHLTIFL